MARQFNGVFTRSSKQTSSSIITYGNKCPANFQQTSSKLPADVQQTSSNSRVFWIHLQEVCWTFAGLCKHPITVPCRTCNPKITQGRRFDSAPGHCRVTTSGKLFTHNVPLSPSSIIWYRLHRWDVNRHTARYTGPVSVVSQCKNWCLAEDFRKRRWAPPYGP